LYHQYFYQKKGFLRGGAQHFFSAQKVPPPYKNALARPEAVVSRL